jgi:magnesium transporter
MGLVVDLEAEAPGDIAQVPNPTPAVVVSDDIDDFDEDNDVYRGEPPPVERRSRRNSASSSSSSSSSSSGSFIGVRQLGVIASVVENAISRWARGNRSSSSISSATSSSSSASSASIITATRSFLGRRRKRNVSTTTLSTLSEGDITARISIIKAREESRQIPREFSLYLPPSLSPPRQRALDGKRQPAPRVTRTSDLNAVLSQLDGALKKSSKARRFQERHAGPDVTHEATEPATEPSSLIQDFMLPDSIAAPSRAASFTRHEGHKGKGKAKDAAERPSVTPKERPIPKAWYLDVASPTSTDMHAIGKVNISSSLLFFCLTFALVTPSPSTHIRRHPPAGSSRKARAFSEAGVLLYLVPGC